MRRFELAAPGLYKHPKVGTFEFKDKNGEIQNVLLTFEKMKRLRHSVELNIKTMSFPWFLEEE